MSLCLFVPLLLLIHSAKTIIDWLPDWCKFFLTILNCSMSMAQKKLVFMTARKGLYCPSIVVKFLSFNIARYAWFSIFLGCLPFSKHLKNLKHLEIIHMIANCSFMLDLKGTENQVMKIFKNSSHAVNYWCFLRGWCHCPLKSIYCSFMLLFLHCNKLNCVVALNCSFSETWNMISTINASTDA